MKIFFLFCLVIGTSLRLMAAVVPDLGTHHGIWGELQAGSWRARMIEGLPISEFLVRSFRENRPGDRQRIVEMYAPEIDRLRGLGELPADFPLKRDDDARTWQRKLNFIELRRFKETFMANPNLINDENFENDDIVRARSLCGTFCLKAGTRYYRLFTGMLTPEQAFIEGGEVRLYDVHTCLHGFYGRQIADIYFVPYGLPAIDQFAFRVSSLYEDPAAAREIMQGAINDYSRSDNNPYNKRDYVLAKILPTSVNGATLRTVLDREGVALPELFGFEGDFNLEDEAQFNKLFIIGRTSSLSITLTGEELRGFAIATNLTNFSREAAGKRRSHMNNPGANQAPEGLGNFMDGEFLSDYPTYPGLSGGPILECKLMQDSGVWQRRCRLVGVNFGSERVFQGEQFVDLKSITSSIDLH